MTLSDGLYSAVNRLTVCVGVVASNLLKTDCKKSQVKWRKSFRPGFEPQRTVSSDSVSSFCLKRFTVAYTGTYGRALGQWSSCHAGLNKEAKTGSDWGPLTMLVSVCDEERGRDCLWVLELQFKELFFFSYTILHKIKVIN